MATLTQEMKEMIATQQCFIGTADADGMPNVAPKRSTRVLTDDSLIFTEGTGGTTYANIKRGSKVAVAVVAVSTNGLIWLSYKLCKFVLAVVNAALAGIKALTAF